MPLNDSPDRRQGSHGDPAMRRRPPQNGRPPHDGGFSDRQARRRKRNTLGSQAILFKRQSLLHRIDSRTRTYIVIWSSGYCSPFTGLYCVEMRAWLR